MDYLNGDFLGLGFIDYLCLLAGFIVVYSAEWINKRFFKWENESLFIRVFIAVVGSIIICLVLYVLP
jgi:fructose-specific phosphotransferase system IIC component